MILTYWPELSLKWSKSLKHIVNFRYPKLYALDSEKHYVYILFRILEKSLVKIFIGRADGEREQK